VDGGWPILISLIPYLLLLPKILKILRKDYDHSDGLKKAARMNVQIHLLFSLLFIFGIGISIVL
jgi:hypothetical protein